MSATVLLVDDHDANRHVIRRRLERRGFAVEEASDGDQALRKCGSLRLGCVVMDLSMPTMSGFEAIARIHSAEQTAALPVIALTAHAMDSVREKCLAAGFFEFLTKPVDFEALVAHIQSATSKQP